MALLSQTNTTRALTGNPKHSVITTEVEILGDEVLAASDGATPSESSESRSDHDTEHSDSSENAVLQSAEQKLAVEADKDTVSSSPSAQTEAEILTAIRVLQVVETYGAHGDAAWDGLAGYVPLLVKQITARRPIQLMFSGFGFKSPLTHGKVLGSVPDLGEKLALAHLDGLCSNIAAVYKQGAEMHICSDGLVYNDLFGVSDEDVWLYGNKLEEMAKSSDLSNIRFLHLGDILDHDTGIWTKEHTTAHAPCIRRELQYRYADASSISSDGRDDAIRNYVAQMLSPDEADRRPDLVSELRTRWVAYASLIEANKSEAIQLSAHDFGAARGTNRLTISLLPQNTIAEVALPWQCAIVVRSDGSYRAANAIELQNDSTCELVADAAGTPSHYRTNDEIWDWNADGLDVTFEHLYPTGTIIRPVTSQAGPAPSIQTLPMRKVRRLAQRFSPIVLRGFSETTNEEYFLAKGNELGEILTWTFGQILKVKDSGEVDKNANNVTSNEAMPMHFDGIFKFVDKVDPETGVVKKVLTPPRYQYFTCLSTAPKGDGYTLFANSRLFFQHLPPPFTFSRLEKATWSMVNDGFWSAKQTELPLVVRHKETGEPCLRWHEPWTNTKFSKYFIEIENDEEGPQLGRVINKLLYDYRVCLRFEWENGDLLINDNVSMLHTRTAFAGNCEREMWRIHFD